VILSPQRIAAVCGLGSVEGAELLGRARAGDVAALEDWLVYSVMAKLSETLPRAQATAQTIRIMSQIDVRAGSHGR